MFRFFGKQRANDEPQKGLSYDPTLRTLRFLRHALPGSVRLIAASDLLSEICLLPQGWKGPP